MRERLVNVEHIIPLIEDESRLYFNIMDDLRLEVFLEDGKPSKIGMPQLARFLLPAGSLARNQDAKQLLKEMENMMQPGDSSSPYNFDCSYYNHLVDSE